jgi:hypothetical protein
MAREGARVKLEIVGQTTRYWVGQDKQEWYMWEKVGMRFSLIQGRGHGGHIRSVIQEDSRSSMYGVYRI